MKTFDSMTVKAGDSVFVGNVHDERRRVEAVVRITNTQIVTENGGVERRYNRATGRPYGGFAIYYITGTANQAEIKAYEAKRARERDEARQQTELAEARRAKCVELSNLFNGRAFVDYEGDSDELRVEFQPMTEEAVRLLAEQTKI